MKILILSFMMFFSVFAQAYGFPNSISPLEANSLIEQNQAILIDVREQQEVAQGMAKPALFYPKSSIDANIGEFIVFLANYPDKKIIIYCRSGQRASVVVAALSQRGILAFNMGGFRDWVAAGLETKIP